MAFSMSMEGTPREKLHWAFRLYDKDGDEIIGVNDKLSVVNVDNVTDCQFFSECDEMEDVFERLCKIANNMEAAQIAIEKERAQKEAARKAREEAAANNAAEEEKAKSKKGPKSRPPRLVAMTLMRSIMIQHDPTLTEIHLELPGPRGRNRRGRRRKSLRRSERRRRSENGRHCRGRRKMPRRKRRRMRLLRTCC